MNAKYTFAAILLGLINVILNYAALRAAKSANSLSDAVTSIGFVPAFFLGCISLVCMLWMYFSGMPLARGLLIAGATSILFGTVFSAVIFGTKLTIPEWGLWAAIAIFYMLRFTSLAQIK